MNYIIKRDGRKEIFEKTKIIVAMEKASEAAGNQYCISQKNAKIITEKVLVELEKKYTVNIPTVEEIQDQIEKVLIAENFFDIAKHYILYRAERTRIRNSKTRLMKTMREITFKSSKDSDKLRENANINGDTAMGTMLKYGSEAAKEFYLQEVINPRFSKAHIDGLIHIHDLDFYSLTTTCCQIDLFDLFNNGFSTGNGFIREPNSIRSYASLACIVIQANQNDQHGGQSIPNFDYVMAEGVKKTYKKAFVINLYKLLSLFDNSIEQKRVKELVYSIENDETCIFKMNNERFINKLVEVLKEIYPIDNIEEIVEKAEIHAIKDTEYETYQSMEALIHNLNTMHSRAGAQVPFSSLNYGTDTSDEGRMVMKCLLDATLKGLGNGETAIFPIQIFKVKSGINFDAQDKNYDLFKQAILVSSKRLFPNFSFLDAPYNLKHYREGDYNSEVAYMGCRTRVIGNVDKTKEVTCGRGNLSFTSINLPRLAFESANIDEFKTKLAETMDLVRDQLLERLEIQSQKKVYNFPFLMGQGIWLDSEKLKKDEEIREVLKHGTLSIGFIGLAEALKKLTGYHHGESEASQKIGLEIIGLMRKKCDEYTEKLQLNFTLLATPAEGLSGRFVKLDREKYGLFEGITDHEFYTNSFHIPVYYPISIVNKIKKEAPYNELTNAGHITYVEVDGDIANNLEAFEKIIRFMHDEGIGYGSINHPVDRDPLCGYNGIINDVCPKCGRREGNLKFERIRRITGYLVGTLDRFNDAKKAEERERVKHGIN